MSMKKIEVDEKSVSEFIENLSDLLNSNKIKDNSENVKTKPREQTLKNLNELFINVIPDSKKTDISYFINSALNPPAGTDMNVLIGDLYSILNKKEKEDKKPSEEELNYTKNVQKEYQDLLNKRINDLYSLINATGDKEAKKDDYTEFYNIINKCKRVTISSGDTCVVGNDGFLLFVIDVRGYVFINYSKMSNIFNLSNEKIHSYFEKIYPLAHIESLQHLVACRINNELHYIKLRDVNNEKVNESKEKDQQFQSIETRLKDIESKIDKQNIMLDKLLNILSK